MANIKAASLKVSTKGVSVFIDAANFEISLKSCGLKAEYKDLIKTLQQRGKLVILRYYTPSFGTKGQNRFFGFIKNIGFKIVTKNLKLIKQRGQKSHNKANFDVEITFDAAVRIGQYDELILFSGDSDFVYLVSELKKRGVRITVISPHWRTARELKKEADEFIDLRDCSFVKRKLPFGSAHDNLSTAQKSISKKG